MLGSVVLLVDELPTMVQMRVLEASVAHATVSRSVQVDKAVLEANVFSLASHVWWGVVGNPSGVLLPEAFRVQCSRVTTHRSVISAHEDPLAGLCDTTSDRASNHSQMA